MFWSAEGRKEGRKEVVNSQKVTTYHVIGILLDFQMS